MTQEEQKMVRDILDTESMGYACVYPLDRGEQEAGTPLVSSAGKQQMNILGRKNRW